MVIPARSQSSLGVPLVHGAPGVPSRLLLVVLLAAAYFVAAKVGFGATSAHPLVSAAWPPAGLALAALLVFGTRVWPAIALGAFIANVTGGTTAAGAAGIALGNTLEALAAVVLLRWAAFRPSLERLRDVLAFGVLATLLSPVISASIGVVTLWLVGSAATAQLAALWLTWWSGDALGILIIAPAAFTWATQPSGPGRNARALEIGVVVILLSALTALIFRSQFDFVYPLFPLAALAAYRMGPRGAAVANITVAAVAIVLTITGTGPFVRTSPAEDLIVLQGFIGLLALTTLGSAAILAERHAVADELRRANLDLEARVRERTAALREADQRKDEFLATLAHELRNPIAALLLSVERLRRKVPAEQDSENALDIIDRQLQHLTRLTDDLIDINRITRGKLRLQHQRIELSQVLSVAIETVQTIIQRKAHTLVLSLPEETIELDGDFVRLSQVFANLLDNAAKYTDRGGHIWVKAARQAHEVVVTIRDDGVGIDPAVLTAVFDLFAQASQAPSSDAGGLGIGLTLVRQLVEMHGGNVTARSDGHGTGAEFVVRLPLSSGLPPKERRTPRLPLRRRLTDRSVIE